MASELHYSDTVNPAFFEAAGNRQWICATAVVGLGYSQKVAVHAAKGLGQNGPRILDVRAVAAELFATDDETRNLISGVQRVIVSARGAISFTDVPQIAFVAEKKELMESILHHPHVRILRIESIGSPSLNATRDHSRQQLHPAGVA